MKYFLLYFLFLLNNSFSQEKNITIKCKKEQDLIIDATIYYGKNKFFTANKNGVITVPIIENTIYTVIAPNYKSIKLTADELKKIDELFLAPDIFDLEQVILTGSSEPKKVDNSIYNIQLIKADYLERLGANTLSDALRFQSNTQITQDGILGTRISMQGMSGEHIKILIDGIPLIGREDGNIDLSQIDISNIEHIEIIEGPLSVIYGSNALGGTINIITKKRNIKKIASSINTYYETVGQYNGKFLLSSAGQNYSISGDIGTSIFTGFDLDKSNRSMLFNPKNQYFINSNYTYLGESFNFELGVNITIEDLNIIGNHVDLFKNYANDINFITDRGIFFTKINLNLNENNKLLNQFSYSRYSRKRNTYYKNFINNTEELTKNIQDHDTTSFHNLNARIILESKYEKIDFQNGIDYNFDKGNGGKITGQRNMNDFAYWGNYSYNFSESFKIQPALRVTYNDNFSTPLLYSFSAYWNDNDNYKLKFSTAKGFRAPSLKERYFNFVDASHKIFGNESLKPESSYHFSSQFNYKRLLGDNMGIGFDISIFYNNLNDVIELSLRQNADGTYTDSYTYNNIGNKTTYGGSIFLSSQKHKRYQGKIGVDFMNSGYKVDGKFLSGDNFNFMGIFSYTLPYIETSLNFDYKYNGEMILILSSGNSLSKAHRDSYHMFNISTSRSFYENRINITIGLKNIFDVTDIPSTNGGVHSASTTPISWGRTFFAKLNIDIF